jgi:hypothetical protein
MSTERAEVLDLKPLLYALLVILVEAWQRFHCFTVLVITVADETLAVLVAALLLLLFLHRLFVVLMYLSVG